MQHDIYFTGDTFERADETHPEYNGKVIATGTKEPWGTSILLVSPDKDDLPIVLCRSDCQNDYSLDCTYSSLFEPMVEPRYKWSEFDLM